MITVCDSAANEPCPLWMREARRAHWGMPDPSIVTGNEADVERAFLSVMDALESQLSTLQSQLLENVRI